MNNQMEISKFTISDYKNYATKYNLPYYSYKKFAERNNLKCKGCTKNTTYVNITYLCEMCSFDVFKQKHWKNIKEICLL